MHRMPTFVMVVAPLLDVGFAMARGTWCEYCDGLDHSIGACEEYTDDLEEAEDDA